MSTFMCDPREEFWAQKGLHAEPAAADLHIIPRLEAKYENLSARFRLQDKSFRSQYASLYYQRLVQMRPAVMAEARRKWAGNGAIAWPDTILALQGEGARSVVIGTLYKDMSLKPNILDEYHAREQYEAPPPSRSKYNDDSNDRLELEDESGRVVLVGAITVPNLVSGVVVAVLGAENSTGEFVVEAVCVQGLGPQTCDTRHTTHDAFVCLASGLDMHADHTDAALPLSLFIDFVTGRAGGGADQVFVANIVRVIVAGNLIAHVSEAEAADQAKYKLKNIEADSVRHMRQLDDVLTQLASGVPTDIMPGDNDPSNNIVPQQPLHSCMFPRATQLCTLAGVTNPYHCAIDGRQFLGTSGQGVDDIYRYSGEENRLNILIASLQWGHLFPTAPDTLGCFPLTQCDPFVIEACPSVYFAGNQPEFAAQKIAGHHGQECLVVCVPRFSTTHTVVLVNTRTLEATPLTFSARGSLQTAAPADDEHRQVVGQHMDMSAN